MNPDLKSGIEEILSEPVKSTLLCPEVVLQIHVN